MPRLRLDLLTQIRAAGLPEPVPEFRFHPERKWRFDLAYPPPLMVAVEREGGIWTGGRHVRGRGYENDAVKYSEAAILGWLVVRCTAGMIRDGRALDLVRRALASRQGG